MCCRYMNVMGLLFGSLWLSQQYCQVAGLQPKQGLEANTTTYLGESHFETCRAIGGGIRYPIRHAGIFRPRSLLSRPSE